MGKERLHFSGIKWLVTTGRNVLGKIFKDEKFLKINKYAWNERASRV